MPVMATMPSLQFLEGMHMNKVLVAGILGLMLTACGQKEEAVTPAADVAAKVEQAASEASATVEQAADQVADKAAEAGEATKQAAADAGAAVEQAASDAADKVEAAVSDAKAN